MKCIRVIVYGAAFNILQVQQVSSRASRFFGMPNPTIEILHCIQTVTWIRKLHTEENKVENAIEPGLLENERMEMMLCLGICISLF